MNAASKMPDEDFLKRAVDLADINALRLALYQHTGDPELAAMPVNNERREGNPFRYTRLSEAHHETVKEKALHFLRGGPHGLEVPDKQEATRLMQIFAGRDLAQADIDYAWGDLGFEPFVRGAEWGERPSQAVLDAYDITIVGAGFGGLLAAIQLQRLGLDFRIIERQSGVGGTWWLNDYPGARVDVTSFLYQYKFELGYPWKNYYPTQGELLEYLDHLLDKYALREKIILDTKVTQAEWDETQKKWRIRTEGPGGVKTSYNSDFFISASGQFSTAKLPDIPGIETFGQEMFHSTEWNHDCDLSGKRVAVVGTGSTGSQMVRGIAEKASSLTVYQRTPNWIMQMPQYRDAVPDEVHWLMDNMPGYLNWYIFSQHISQMRMDGINEVDHEWVARGGLFNERNDQLREILKAYILKSVNGDQNLYEKLVPDYAPLARRPVVDNDFYRTLTLDHVELVAGPIDHFNERGIVSPDGTEREFDVVVLCAGFQTERFLWPVDYVGRDGATLDELWSHDGPRAYLASLLPGFPNFVMMYGPNSGLVAGSFHSWIEIFSAYYCQIIVKTIEAGASSFEVRQDAYDQFNRELDERASTWVFQIENGGGGYYMNEHGRSSVRLPWRVPEFFEKVRQPNFDHFEIR